MLFNLSLNRLTKAVSCAALSVTLAVVAYPEQKASAQLSDRGLELITNLVNDLRASGIECSSNIVEANATDVAEFEDGVTDCAVTLISVPNVDEQVVINPINVPIQLAYNVPDFNANLSTDEVCGIISGTITDWNEVGGPDDLPITFVYRSDSSSTTTILNNFTTQNCGFSLPPFPTGIDVEGSDGVVSKVQSTEGSIAYIDKPTAIRERLSVATLYETPIVGSIYVVFRSFYDDPNKTTAVRNLCSTRITNPF